MPYDADERYSLIAISDEVSTINRRILTELKNGTTIDDLSKDRERLDELLRMLDDLTANVRHRKATQF